MSKIIWRFLQIIVGLIGISIYYALIYFPKVGLHAFWNVLIPIAPILIVLATGIWRNICPLASTSLLPRHFGVSMKKSISPKWQKKLQLISVLTLIIIVPLRHTIFNTSGLATAILIGFLGLIAIIMGFIFEWKSGWCSSLCPIHPVEKLYGRQSLFKIPNMHCTHCVNCVNPCPDSTPSIHPLSRSKKELSYKIAGILIIGGFPGFIWGWFHVPDFYVSDGWSNLYMTYSYSFGGLLISMIAYILLQKLLLQKIKEQLVINIFAFASVSIYYWYRIPSLFGYGLFHTDGMLVDLSETVSFGFISALRIMLVIFFLWWFIFRNVKKSSWETRPPFLKS